MFEYTYKKAMRVLHWWLVMVIVVMMVNANVATPYLLSSTTNPVPFYVIAALAFLWLIFSWHDVAVITASCCLVMGTYFRGWEVLIYAESLSFNQRITACSLWWFISGTGMAFGVLNLISVSYKYMDKANHDRD